MTGIYLDYNSTTPVDERVLEGMLPWFSVHFGNAGSNTHHWGREAARMVERSREQVSNLLGCEPAEVVFTSGATEAINLAIRGAMSAYKNSGNHLITVSTEHKAVLDTCASLELEGIEVTRLGVDYEGRIDLAELEGAIRKTTVMVVVMNANNETGVLQDVESIGKLCSAANILFFSDVTQAAGKLKIDVKACNMSMACISAHKFYGPKGVGALYVSRKSPRVTLAAQITGGGQERGLRSGTLNVPGIAGMGIACELASAELWETSSRLSSLRTIFEQLLEQTCNVRINGSIKHRLPNTSNVQFPGITASKLITAVPQLGISTGSACTSALPEPSHVLTAMGLSSEIAQRSIRLSLGKYTSGEDVYEAVELFARAVRSHSKD